MATATKVGKGTVRLETQDGERTKDFDIPVDGIGRTDATVGGKCSRTHQEAGTNDFVKVEVWAEIPAKVEDKNPALKKLMGEMTDACSAFMTLQLNERG